MEICPDIYCDKITYPFGAQLAALFAVVDGVLDLLPHFESLGLANDVAEVEEDLLVVVQGLEEAEAVLYGRDVAVHFFVRGVSLAVGGGGC